MLSDKNRGGDFSRDCGVPAHGWLQVGETLHEGLLRKRMSHYSWRMS